MLIQHKLSGHQLLAGIGGHGINTRQIRHQGVAVTTDHTVFPIYGHTREIAHMLVGSRQLVKQGRLSTVLVSRQGKGQNLSFRKWMFSLLHMIPSALSKSRMVHDLLVRRPHFRHGVLHLSNLDFLRIRQTQGQFITMYPHLHWISHGGIFHHSHLRRRNDTHIQKMLPQSALSAYRQHRCHFPNGKVF